MTDTNDLLKSALLWRKQVTDPNREPLTLRRTDFDTYGLVFELEAEVKRLSEQREADRRLIASTDQALTRALERAETAEGPALIEGIASKLGSDYASVVITVDNALRTSYWHEYLNGRRVRVVAADPAPTDPCTRCGHSWVRHKIGRCSMCSQSCPGFAAADPAPTALVEALTAVDEARQRFYDAPDTEATVDASVPLARAKDALEAAVRAVVAADPAPTDPEWTMPFSQLGHHDMPGPDTTEGGR